MKNETRTRTVKFPMMLGYGLGECANSLVLNGVYGFAMLYYTEALHLNPALAGLAMSISVFWDAITDPVMGHLTDHTRSRFGRRHPWMLFGGLLMALCFYFIWAVPEGLRGQAQPLFWYLVVMNILLRTGLTIFFIPYLALGFEMCPDYEGRSKIQAIRQVLNMAANFAGPAMAWSIFFRDPVGPDGVKIVATTVPENFVRMGAAFSLATAGFALLVLWITRRWMEDSRVAPGADDALRKENFWRDLRQVILDPHPRWLFAFTFLVCVDMVLVSSLQMYVYVYFMKFEPYEKSLAHGSTMIGMALGAAASAWLAARLEKRGAVLLGGGLSVACNALLAALFLTGWIPVGTGLARTLFVLLHAAYWLGNGIMMPLATSMMADVAEVHRARTGVNKSGIYSAMFSLAMKLAVSFGMVASGLILNAIGFASHTGASTQTPEVIWRLGAMMLLAGPLVAVAALAAIARYPLSRSMVVAVNRADEQA